MRWGVARATHSHSWLLCHGAHQSSIHTLAVIPWGGTSPNLPPFSCCARMITDLSHLVGLAEHTWCCGRGNMVTEHTQNCMKHNGKCMQRSPAQQPACLMPAYAAPSELKQCETTHLMHRTTPAQKLEIPGYIASPGSQYSQPPAIIMR